VGVAKRSNPNYNAESFLTGSWKPRFLPVNPARQGQSPELNDPRSMISVIEPTSAEPASSA
jgi:hypothetical protein